MTKIYSINKLCSLLHLRKDYLLDLANRANSCYRSYNIKIVRQDGSYKLRRIDSPNSELKKVQTRINKELLSPIAEMLPNYIHGSRRGKSIATNASAHVKKEAILSLDITNCFPSITSDHLRYVYKKCLRCSDEVFAVLFKLTTKDGSLPQGCPTSGTLCNLALSKMLDEMAKIAIDHNLDFSHYVDDIFFSGSYKDICNVKHLALREIKKYGLIPNSKKIHINKSYSPQKVTGVYVNIRMSAGRSRIRKIERKILGLKANDVYEYEAYRRHAHQKIDQKSKTQNTPNKIKRIYGEISSVSSINKQQGGRLKIKLETAIAKLKRTHSVKTIQK